MPTAHPPPEARRATRSAATTLLLIGVHREELPFGRTVADALRDDDGIAVLAIPEGLSGRRPRPDERFRYDTLHGALYQQVLPHVVARRHRLLVDLHAGEDTAGPSADLYCADAGLRAALEAALARERAGLRGPVRIVTLGSEAPLHAHTVIPPAIWTNPAFLYLGIEIFLPAEAEGRRAGCELARRLVRLAVACAEPAEDAVPARQGR